MSKKLYVGNLSFKVDDETLRETFAAAGEVLSARIITDETGRSKGFGFVEMNTAEDAEKAVSTLNGSSIMDRNIIVNEARPQTERGSRPFGNTRQGRPQGRPYGRGRE